MDGLSQAYHLHRLKAAGARREESQDDNDDLSGVVCGGATIPQT